MALEAETWLTAGLPRHALQSASIVLGCTDMHTTDEATRIVHSGYSELRGTLLAQRREAQE